MLPSHLKLILGLLVLLTVSVLGMPNTSTGDPGEKSADETTWITLKTENPDGAKAGEPATKPAKGQYTLKFVPLIRIIASFLPRLLSRFTSRIQGGRSLDNRSMDELRATAVEKMFAAQTCSTQHLGRWADPQNVHQFFECAVNVDSLPECSEVAPSVTREIMEQLSMNHRSIRSINPSPPGGNRLVKSKSTSTPVVVYKVNPCVSLVLHVCRLDHVFSSRSQHCVPTIPITL